MKKNYFLILALSVIGNCFSQNIYNSDGTILSNRTISLNNRFLNFNSSAAGGNFYINGTNGNVGIGNSIPSEKLQVSGVIKSNNLWATNSTTSASSFASNLAWYKNSYVFGAGYEMNDAAVAGATRRMLNFYDKHGWNSAYIVGNDGFELNVVDRSNKDRFIFTGNKGGGISNGQSYFVINDKNGFENFKISDDGNSNINLQMGKATSRVNIGGYANYPPGIGHKLVVQNGSALIEGNILTNSNIGIGTTIFTDGIDTYRLSVNGNIRAKRVKVYTTWADYVFEKNYILPTLAEVEHHILEKGHLKDIPSARQVEQNGIELGEMNKLLLQKVEELTLYLIAIDKKVKKLESQLKSDDYDK